MQKINANNASGGGGNPTNIGNNDVVSSSPPPSPTSSPANQHNIQRSTHDEDKMAAAASMLDLTTTGPRVGVPHHHNGATPVRHFMNGSAPSAIPSSGTMYIPPVSPRSSSQGTASRDSNSETST